MDLKKAFYAVGITPTIYSCHNMLIGETVKITTEELVEKYKNLIVNIALSLNKDYSEDLVSIGMIVLLENLPQYDSKRGKFSTFIYKRIKGAMLQELNKKGWKLRRKGEKGEDPEKPEEKKTSLKQMVSFDNMETYDSIAENLEDTVIRREKSAVLKNLMADLPEKEQLVLKLIYWNGMTYLEVASYLKVRESWIASLHKKILKKLKGKLVKNGDRE
jgi:RNA polymerase sigma factor for flagellar operon FliA